MPPAAPRPDLPAEGYPTDARQRALVPLTPSADPTLPVAPVPPLPLDVLSPDLTIEAEICIIPGSGEPTPPVFTRRHRLARTQLFVATVVICGLLTALLSFAPLTQAAGHDNSPFNALANLLVLPTPKPYTEYRVQNGDTLPGIAARFHVTLGGLYEMNQLYAGQEVQTGQILRIPTNARYGAAYVPPPLPMLGVGTVNPGGNYIGSCLFCSAGGWTNGPGKPCAAASSANPVDPTQFALVNPNPGSRWVRGFTWDHNGIDTTSMQLGTPIIAAQVGVVIFAGWDPFGAGYAVKINHCGGLATAYGHMEKLLVQVGDSVQMGQTIGLQGATGTATGPHLHFMTWWNNIPFDPLCIYPDIDGVTATQHYLGCPSPHDAPSK